MTAPTVEEKKKLNKYGCKPCEDVCLEHSMPLVTFGMCEDSPELKEFLTTYGAEREAKGREEGKAYWEPSEAHKEVWREEGVNAERARIVEWLERYRDGWLGQQNDGSDRAPEYDVIDQLITHLTTPCEDNQ